jgi:hypothetical protein
MMGPVVTAVVHCDPVVARPSGSRAPDRVLNLGGQQLVQHPQPDQPLGHPPSRQDSAVLGHHGHVVVGLGPNEPTNINPSSFP